MAPACSKFVNPGVIGMPQIRDWLDMTCKILLVDDEPILVEELQEALELEGFDVDTSHSVDTALTACEGTRYDLVVTDLKMPHRGGLDLLRALKGCEDAPTVFVLSGHGAKSNKEEATTLGAKECFSKPVDPDVLSARIRDVCM